MNHEKATQIDIAGWLLNIASNFAEEEGQKEMLQKITKLRGLVIDGGDLVQATDFNNLVKDLRKDSFEDLMNIQDGNDKVNIMIREEKDVITNLILLVRGSDEFVMISLEGAFNLDDLKDLDIDFNGSEHLKKAKKKKGTTKV